MIVMPLLLPLIALQVENCAVTISSSDFGAVSKQEQEQEQEQEQDRAAVEEFPALGSAAGPKKSKNTKMNAKSPAAATPQPSPTRAAAARTGAPYSQVTVLLDASGWTLRMASLDALR